MGAHSAGYHRMHGSGLQGCSLRFFPPFLLTLPISFETGRPAAGRCFFFLAVTCGLWPWLGSVGAFEARAELSPSLCPASAPQAEATSELANLLYSAPKQTEPALA